MTTVTLPTSTVMAPEFEPITPAVPYAPVRIADDTYLIRSLYGEAPMQVYMNSMVILGREPVIVDTGTVGNRRRWLEDVFSLVDPKDVRWIFISHDDHDHVGNLPQALELCPNATLISSWFQVARLWGDLNLPPNRMRWLADGESFDVGDRKLYAIRPPVFDAPTTRGLYDPKTGVYWASDAFAAPVLGGVEFAGDCDQEMWAQGMETFQGAISPWHTMLDEAKFNKAVDRIADLNLTAVAGGHCPITTGSHIDEGLRIIRKMPTQAPAMLPGQETLDQIIAGMTGGA